MTVQSPIFVVDCEGAIETAVKMIYKAMKDKKKTPVNLRFMCTSDWLHEQFLDYLVYYLSCKKVKKVSHVNVDIYIETRED
jgi:hypothetical protein